MFPQNGRKVPEIRFSGFTEEWEQRKLDDIARISKGNGYSKEDLIESGTLIIVYGRLYTMYEISISDVDTFVEAKDDICIQQRWRSYCACSQVKQPVRYCKGCNMLINQGFMLDGDLML